MTDERPEKDVTDGVPVGADDQAGVDNQAGVDDQAGTGDSAGEELIADEIEPDRDKLSPEAADTDAADTDAADGSAADGSAADGSAADGSQVGPDFFAGEELTADEFEGEQSAASAPDDRDSADVAPAHADAADPDPDVARTAGSEQVGAAARTATDGDVWRRAVRAFMHPRLTGAGAVIAVLVGLLGFALIAQVTSNNSSSTLNNDRPDDLVRILSDLDSRKDRLDTEIGTLQTQQQQLSSGALSKQAALNAATQRANELGILAGTLPAEGPGLVIRMEPSTAPISAIVVLETIEELRGAGAEAMEISGTNSPSVRVIASTWIVDGDRGVTVDGVPLQGTLTITAIGDGQTMQTALSIPGGVADTVHDNGGTVLLQQQPRVQVTALAPTGSLKYAHPTS